MAKLSVLRLTAAQPDEVNQFVRREFGGLVGAFEEARDKVALGSVELEDLFFDRVLGHEAIDRDGAGLADAVGAVGRLIFDGGVPPRVEVDHVVGSGQVEARAARFERDQKEVALAALEGIDLFLTMLGGGLAVEVLVRDLAFVEGLFDEGQVRRELAEDEGTVLAIAQFVDGLQKEIELGGRLVPSFVHEARMTR